MSHTICIFMNRKHVRDLRLVLSCLAMFVVVFLPFDAQASGPFVAPTAEELAMKSVPGYPGLPAVVLYQEEVARDDASMVQHYSRIKILTEEGKKYANIEIQSVGGYTTVVDEVEARTIHADGTIVPFTGKPVLKVIEQQSGVYFRLHQTAFTLPDVEVGSIIEYSYTTHQRIYIEPPTWEIQGSLFIKLAHFEWRPAGRVEDSRRDAMTAVSWDPVLPQGVQVVHAKAGYTGVFVSAKDVSYDTYAVTVKDVPPLPDEEFGPPLSSIRYGVRFSYASTIGDKFWSSEGAKWSKEIDHFINPNGDVKKATEGVIAGASTQEDKVRKIYAGVMEMENTAYTRTRDLSEDTAEGHKDLKTVADILARKRGTASGLTSLFIGMARAAGLPAYAMIVPNRAEEIFTPTWLSFAQLSDEIAIVTIDGHERFFDPGSRYCSFGHLAWQHTLVQGMRQNANGAVIDRTPGEIPQTNSLGRVANISLDAEGNVSGRIDLTYGGSAALRWRQTALRTDEAELRRQLKRELEDRLPSTLEVEVAEIKNLTDYEQPLKVSATVKGSMGTATGKRRLIPADLFVARDKATFPQGKRDLPVYFLYPVTMQDALRISFPKSMTLEAMPSSATLEMPQRASYDLSVSSTPISFTTRRHYTFAAIIVPVAEYSQLRNFYSQLQAKDQESVILKLSAAESPVTP